VKPVLARIVVPLFISLSLLACASNASASDTDATADAPSGDTTADDVVTDGGPDLPPPDGLAGHCVTNIGPPRVEQVAPGLYVAIGYDLANTILLTTSAGHVVIDVSMSPTRAQEAKEALFAVVPTAPVHTIIYTHSHIDHVGGASVWVEAGTQIWATDVLMKNFLKQYGAFRTAETERARRQFGQHVSDEELPCSALGRKTDLLAALSTGFVQPTHTFSGSTTLTVGDRTIELVEAHGETDDQLFVWIPALEALMPGDNFYAAFPNLYTIRGTSARPIDEWIASLDAMRGRNPALLLPSHTIPLTDRSTIALALRDYRDAIQFLRDEVVRGANQLEPLDAMVGRVKLPDHLATSPYLAELYGQVDWSVRAIYNQELGWFDGRADQLYPPDNLQMREIELMGGAAAVLAAADAALAGNDPRWASHLLGKLRDSGAMTIDDLSGRLAQSYKAIAAGVENTNGRGYLLERAYELEGGDTTNPPPTIGQGLLDALPASLIFSLLPSRLKVADTLDVESSLVIQLSDGEDWFITVRRGVAEVVSGTALPGTPDPVTTVQTSSSTWVSLSLQVLDPATAVAEGSLVADDLLAVLTFLGYFEQGI